jgi:hypothetical protein
MRAVRPPVPVSVPVKMADLSAYTPDRPLLLVTDYPPTAGGGGAVILRSLLGAQERERILWASPSIPDDGAAASGGGVPLRRGSRSLARWLSRRSLTVDSLLAGRLADEIDELARWRNARALWIVMHGAMVHVAARLCDRTRLPIHLTVHDDPPYGVALMSKRYVGLIPLIARDLGHALRRARSVDVISEGMAKRYRALYGVEAAVVHRGTSAPVAPAPPFAAAQGLEVGILGNTYGHRQLLGLCEAVVEASRRLGVSGRIVVIGQGQGERLRTHAAGRIEIEITGHLDEAAAIERLRRCFLLYLNYPFAARAAVLRQTSFPTKLSTYTAAARPILLHAPPDSSTAPLAAFGDYVFLWENDRSSEGAAVLARAWNAAGAWQSAHAPAEEIRRRHYDLEGNRAALFALLNSLPPPAR